jgi:hypothetical protein
MRMAARFRDGVQSRANAWATQISIRAGSEQRPDKVSVQRDMLGLLRHANLIPSTS